MTIVEEISDSVAPRVGNWVYHRVMTTNEITVGTEIRTTAEVRARAADFPGYGDPDYANFYVDHEAGILGRVTSIESHGMNPWTRYSVLFEDGSRTSGLIPSKFEIVR